VLDTLRQDVTHAARALRRTPGFTAAAIATLTLGVGATAAIFTVVNAALLKPLPYPEPGRVVVLATPQGSAQTGQLFLYLQERTRAVEHVAAQHSGNGWNLVAGDFAAFVKAMEVSTGYFEALGVTPLLGRGFTSAEAQADGPRAVVINEALWRRLYAGRSGALGERLQLGGVPHTVVGVMPEGFRTIPDAEVWTPLTTSPADNTFNYLIVARVAAGSSVDQARSEFAGLRPDIQQDFPRTNARRLGATTWVPMREVVGSRMRTPLFVLLGAVGFVLLIACVNVASLQLTRALVRRRELATRAALGESRLRVARHVVAESVLLGLGGAAAGLVLAVTTARVLPQVLSADAVNQVLAGETLAFDWRVFTFTLTVAVVCSILFAVVPALLSTRVDVRIAMAEGTTATAGRRTAWMRRGLAAAELALAFVLLVGAGLLIRTLSNLTATDPGFQSRDVVVGRMSLQGVAANGPELESLIDRALARIRALPGVVAVSATNGVPVERPYNVAIEPPAGTSSPQPRAVDWRYATPDYFRVFGIRRVAGRFFDERDRAAGEPVAIVNEALARAFFGRVNVVGQTIAIVGAFQDPPRRIVGVVGNVKAASDTDWTRGFTGLGADTAPMLFTPAGQGSPTLIRGTHGAYAMTWSIRTAGPRPGLEGDVRDALRQIDPRLPFIGFEPMAAVVARDLDVPRFLTTLLATFAALAASLAAIGLYGLMAYASSQRVREIGIRMAFGANGGRVLRQFLREGLAVAAVGLVAGSLGAALLTNAIGAYLFGVTPLDGSTYLAAVALLLATASVASLFPALRAARTDPVRALNTP
jgi:predicted permease